MMLTFIQSFCLCTFFQGVSVHVVHSLRSVHVGSAYSLIFAHYSRVILFTQLFSVQPFSLFLLSQLNLLSGGFCLFVIAHAVNAVFIHFIFMFFTSISSFTLICS